MLQEGKEILIPHLTYAFNRMLANDIDLPQQWRMGYIVSIFKGKGSQQEMKNQRGLSPTSYVLKCLKKTMAKRIIPQIEQNTNELQGDGKPKASTEEYLLVLQTMIDKNAKEKKAVKLIIKDVKKAFDQAWSFQKLVPQKSNRKRPQIDNED